MSQLTKHGQERLRKRLGLNKKAMERSFQSALEKGKRTSEFKGRFRKYLDAISQEYRTTPVIYGQNIYIVNKENVLITVFQVPSEYKKYL